MNSASRHSRQGGAPNAHTLEPEGEITTYEKQRNERREALHDSVQKALLDSGFGEAAKLRPLFRGAFSGKQAAGETTRTASRAQRKSLPPEEDVQLHRSARNVSKLIVTTNTTRVLSKNNKQGQEEFFAWPRRTMAKKRSPGRAATNIYEDSDSDNNDEIILRRKEKKKGAADNDISRRSDRSRGENYESDAMPYRSPRRDRRQEWRSPHRDADDEYYSRSARRDRHQDRPTSSRYWRDRSPSLEMSYRDKRGRSVLGKGSDDRQGRQYTVKETYSPKRRSPSIEDRRRRIPMGRGSPYRLHAEEARPKSKVRKRETVLKPVQVDALGILVGMMKEKFMKDINSFVKEMNPCVGYEKQKQQAKDRLHDKIYDEYEVHGNADRVDDKFIKKCATKALITWWHVLNKALDTGEAKPSELNVKYWEELQRIRKSEESKRKSVQMGNQARKRGLWNSTKDKIKQAAVVKLTLDLSREPYQTELDEAVEKEIAAAVLKNEERKKRKGSDGVGSCQNDVKSELDDRILVLEDTVEKLDDRMQVWGSMLTKLYEKLFGKSASGVQKALKKQTPLSEKVQSEVSFESEKSEDEEGSHQSFEDAESSDGMASDADHNNSIEKAAEEPKASAKLKEKIVEDVEAPADVRSNARAGNKSGSGAGPSDRGRPSMSTSEKVSTGVPILKSTVEKRTEPPPPEKTASPKKREESVSGGASKKETCSCEQEVAREEVKESVDNNVEVKDRMRTRNKSQGSKDKATEKQITLETVRQTRKKGPAPGRKRAI